MLTGSHTWYTERKQRRDKLASQEDKSVRSKMHIFKRQYAYTKSYKISVQSVYEYPIKTIDKRQVGNELSEEDISQIVFFDISADDVVIKKLGPPRPRWKSRMMNKSCWT